VEDLEGFESGGDCSRVVAEIVEPGDIWFFAEPGYLALGKAARGSLDLRDSLGKRELTLEVRAQFGVADELEGLGAKGDATGDQLTDFVEPACGEHGFDAGVNTRVESFARRQEADFFYFVTFERGAAAAMNLSHGLSDEDAQLDGADDFRSVARSDARGGFRIETRENSVEMFGAALRGFAAQPFAKIFGARGRFGKTFEKGAKIESCSSHDDWQLFAETQVREDFFGVAAVVASGENFLGLN
jgi:hypothetical protein